MKMVAIFVKYDWLQYARYVPIPKMDDYRPSRSILLWLFIADHTKIIQKWMSFCVISL